MSKLKAYEVAGPGSRYGLMVCGSCGKSVNPPGVEPSAYAVRETPEAYIVQHRDCMPALWEMWSKYDRNVAQQKQNAAEFKAACIAFYEKWGVSDFTDEIEDR